MTMPEEVLIADARAFLRREVMTQLSNGRSDLFTAFCAWAVPNLENLQLGEIGHRVAAHTGAERAYRDVAVLAFMDARSALPRQEADALANLLVWVSQCSIEVDGAPVGISTDALAMLGIAIAAAAARPTIQPKVVSWINKATNAALQLPGLDPWKRGLMGVSQRIAARDSFQYNDIRDLTCDVALVCSAKGFGQLEEGRLADCQLTVLDSVRSLEPILDVTKSGFQLAALELILRMPRTIRPAHATVEDVAQILSRLEGAFRRWTWEETPKTKRGPARQWHIDHEYHLQNILWFLLYPIFPNLRDEEYLASTGQLQPRSDLCIPYLGLVIEAKFMYPKTTPRQMIEEISADASLYLKAGSGFNSIIPVIWDEQSRIEDHAILRRGLNEIRGVIDSIIISRPAKMSVHLPVDAKQRSRPTRVAPRG